MLLSDFAPRLSPTITFRVNREVNCFIDSNSSSLTEVPLFAHNRHHINGPYIIVSESSSETHMNGIITKILGDVEFISRKP